MERDLLNPKYYNAIMWMQAVSTFCIFFLPVYFFAMICYRSPSKFMGFNTNITLRQVLVVLVILMFTFPLSGALAELNKIIPIPKNWEIYFKEKEAERSLQEAVLININSFSRYILSMVIIGLLPAVFEEVCFRGGIQNILTRWFKGPWIAILLTAILFSAVHISYYGFFVRLALGVILGLVFYYSHNLWLPILIHFLYNGLQVTALYIATMEGKKPMKDIEDNFPLWAGIIALAFIVYAFVYFKKITLEQQKKYVMPKEDPNDFHDWITRNS